MNIRPLLSRFIKRSLIGFALLGFSAALVAQTPAPAAGASAPAGADDKIPDWVKKQAENPMKWIIQQDSKPKAKVATPEEKAVKRAAAKKAKAEEDTVAATPTPPPRATPTAPSVTATPTPAKAAVVEPATDTPAVEPAKVATLAPAPEPEPLKSAKAALDELVPISQAQPVLSRDILQAGIRQGRVVVKFNVNADGSVTDVAVSETSDKLLNKSVVAAVKQWIYKPINQAQSNTAEIAFKLE